MDVRLLHFDDCPNWRLAEARLNQALAAMGDDPAGVEHAPSVEQLRSALSDRPDH
jgi:hypothetical protein